MRKLFNSLEIISNSIGTTKYQITLDREWKQIQAESIDYGILEKTKNIFSMKANFQWNDIGSWYSLYSILTKNKDNSHHTGNVISIKSENNLVISPNKLTAVIGIKDMTIINLADATLIVPHSESEAVKDVVQMLRTMNKSEYL